MKKITIILMIFIIYISFFNFTYKKFYKNVTDEVQLEAIVLSDEVNNEHYKAYKIKGKSGIFKNKKFILYTNKELNYGDKVEIKGIFNEPEEQRNYKGFSYKDYLKTQNIYGSIKAKRITVIEQKSINKFLITINNVRNAIKKNIKTLLPEESSGLLIGILLGDKEDIKKDIVKSFQRSGLAHVLAVSGTHISFVIMGIAFILKKFKISKKIGYFITIFILIIFMFLTNFTPSIIRASIMAIIIIISKIIHRKANVINTIIICLSITIISNPYLIKNVGLQLSYLGTIGVIFISPIIQEIFKKIKINNKIIKIISVPISAQIAILPIIIINFHTISALFLLSNIIVLPLLGVIILLGFTSILISWVWIWGAKKISIIINLILKIIALVAKFCGNISNFYIVIPRIFTIIIYYFFLVIIVYLYNLKNKKTLSLFESNILSFYSKIPIKKVFVLIIIIVVLIEFPYERYNGKLKIYFIDIGQRR